MRHRVAGYRAGDLERRYPTLAVEEDYFVNYGFLPRAVHALMHPRQGGSAPSVARRGRAEALLAFVRERGEAHPRDVDRHFAHGRVTNYWGGSSSATTHLLIDLHYRGLLRVARRDDGIRVYAVREPMPGAEDAPARRARVDALIDVIVGLYAPLPGASLSSLVGRLRYGVPQWRRYLKDALQRARQRLSHARLNGVDWYWPAGERIGPRETDHRVRLLAPFDPIVWDRRRFELLWGWGYRFEAYTPEPKRKLGYYALPVLWRDRVIGWANVSMNDGALRTEFGYVGAEPRNAVYRRELEAELDRLRVFLR